MYYKDFANSLTCANLPYDDDDDDFKPLTNPNDIKAWDNWLQYTADTIGITYDKLKSKQFTTLVDLFEWCSTGSRYNKAYETYNKQCDKYCNDWAKFMKKIEKSVCKNYSIDTIVYVLKGWLIDLFNKDYIWLLDGRSIIQATTWSDVCIFDTSPRRNFICNYLIPSGLEYLSDDEDSDDEDSDEE